MDPYFEFGKCWCGCDGVPTTFKITLFNKWQVKGFPRKYVSSHNEWRTSTRAEPDILKFKCPVCSEIKPARKFPKRDMACYDCQEIHRRELIKEFQMESTPEPRCLCECGCEWWISVQSAGEYKCIPLHIKDSYAYDHSPIISVDRGLSSPCYERVAEEEGRFRRIVIARSGGHSEYSDESAWRMMNGPVPNGFRISHICGVRKCENVEHMELVKSGEYRISAPPEGIEIGRCWCGCGGITNIADRTRNGVRKGEYNRYMNSHGPNTSRGT